MCYYCFGIGFVDCIDLVFVMVVVWINYNFGFVQVGGQFVFDYEGSCLVCFGFVVCWQFDFVGMNVFGWQQDEGVFDICVGYSCQYSVSCK